MPVYSVLGGFLDSEIEFAGLRPVLGREPSWMFRIGHGLAYDPVAVIGREEVSDELTITLSRTRDGSVLVGYDAFGLGDFRISPDGREIVWRPGESPRMDALRWVLMGRVMATALYVGGTLCLHGSAVVLAGEGICFLAPKHHGKSTLAAALLAAGGRLASDDLLPIDPGPPVRMIPGVPVLRLVPDSEAAVALAGRESRRTPEDVGKTRIDLRGGEELIAGPHPLSAVYVLAPLRDEPEPGRAAGRIRLDGMDAFHTLVRHTSIAPLLSAAEAGLLLSHASTLARSVPIYRLRFVRDFTRLDDVVAAVKAWHGSTADAPAS